MEKIDFVVLWVDGNDPKWLTERAQHMPKTVNHSNEANRFRDWDLMKYWFRGVDKFASWVNNVYFVTWGHVPAWLNLEHPKLKVIKHTDYIPQKYLPTYNSNVIELHLHNIPELSERFVLFNDDMFLTDFVKETDFFRKGLPCETITLGQGFASSTDDTFSYAVFNNIAIINNYFAKKEVMKNHWRKFLSWKYGKALIRNVLLLPFGHFSGFLDSHLPTSHLKNTFVEIWDKEREYLEEYGMSRFRTKENVTHWLMKNWRACQGRFVPRSINWGRSFSIGHDTQMIKAIIKQKYKAVCVNDDDPNIDFEYYQKELAEAFESILPQKSSFEK